MVIIVTLLVTVVASLGADHHFTDIIEDLTLLVVFAPPTTPEV
jgi:hypothetical protein